MNLVLSVFWTIALTKSADCELAKAQCPGQVGPDAVLITATETRVYKDRYVHSMMQHKAGEMPIINATNPISDEFDFPKDYAIRAVTEDSKRRYFFDDLNSYLAMVCTDNQFNCQPAVRPTRLFRANSLSAASNVSQGHYLAFTDGQGDEYQAIRGHDSILLHKQKLDKMADGRKRNPTGLTVLGTVGNRHRFIAFFDVLYGYYVQNLNELAASILIRKDFDYRLSNTWLGCDQELCFDSRMDFAYHEQGSIVMGRGHARWRFDLSNKAEPQAAQKEDWVADAVIKETDLMMLFRGDMTTVTNQTERNLPTQHVFKETNSPIEAAFSLETSRVYLISDQSVYIYNYSSSNPYDYNHLRTMTVKDMFNIFETKLDAALSIDNETIYLFRKNHYYTHNVETNITSAPLLIQNTLFTCSDSFYSSSKASQMLNITNAEQFKQYRMQFAKKEQTTVTTSTVATSTVSKTPRGKKNTIRLLFFTIIILILSVMACILSVMVFSAHLKKLRQAIEDRAELSLRDDTKNTDSVSTEKKQSN
ncbi:hypothetical protein HDE_00249 [Halotydeus destructor]|nr:hypothetical protein HDE_00249 [Halotydeus destructor]